MIFFILMLINLIFTSKVLHLTSFWKWQYLEFGLKWPANWVMYRTFTVFIGADGRPWKLCLKNLVLPLLKSVLNKKKSKSESDFYRQVLQHSQKINCTASPTWMITTVVGSDWGTHHRYDNSYDGKRSYRYEVVSIRNDNFYHFKYSLRIKKKTFWVNIPRSLSQVGKTIYSHLNWINSYQNDFVSKWPVHLMMMA